MIQRSIDAEAASLCRTLRFDEENGEEKTGQAAGGALRFGALTLGDCTSSRITCYFHVWPLGGRFHIP